MLWCLLALAVSSQALAPRIEDGKLAAAGVTLRFLEGKPLERLRNGQAVSFDFQLTLMEGARAIERTQARFVLSYDLWEESYSAVLLGKGAVKSGSRLKADRVTEWCVGQMRLPVPAVARSLPLRLQLEVRSAGAKVPNPLRPQGDVDLGVLVEIFSRPPEAREIRVVAQSEPFTLGMLERP